MSPFRFGIVMYRAVASPKATGAPGLGQGAQVVSVKGARMEAPKALSGMVSEKGVPSPAD